MQPWLRCAAEGRIPPTKGVLEIAALERWLGCNKGCASFGSTLLLYLPLD